MYYKMQGVGVLHETASQKEAYLPSMCRKRLGRALPREGTG